MDDHARATLRLPKKLAFTVIRVAVVGAVACSGESSPSPADASSDATADACTNPQNYCVPAGSGDAATCPPMVCTMAECPPGCIFEPPV